MNAIRGAGRLFQRSKKAEEVVKESRLKRFGNIKHGRLNRDVVYTFISGILRLGKEKVLFYGLLNVILTHR